MPRENSVPVRGWIPPSMCVCVCMWGCIVEHARVWACTSYRKCWIFRLVRALYHSTSVWVNTFLCNCKRLCRNACDCVYVFVRAPSALAKVIHHHEHQMTSPQTPILQLLPFHLPLIHHSDGLAGCHHPPASPPPPFSSSLHLVVHLTQLCCCTESAESSPLATIYKADMGQLWGVLVCVCVCSCVWSCMSPCVLAWWIYNQYSTTSQPLYSCKAVAVLMNCDSHGVHYDSR